MARIALFRLKVFSNNPSTNPDGVPDRIRVLKNAVRSSPEAKTTQFVTWLFGNIEEISTDWWYFHVGKTTKTRNEVYQDGNFVELPSDASPSTSVFLNFPLGIVGLVPKSLLSPHIKGIAARLEDVLNNSNPIKAANANVELSEVLDSTEFIKEVENAEAIEKFWFRLKPPNPPDEAEILKALSTTLAKLNGRNGKLEVKGTALSSEQVVEIASSAMSAGNDVGATIRDANDVEGRPIKSSDMGRKELTVKKIDLVDRTKRAFIAGLIQRAYDSVRRRA